MKFPQKDNFFVYTALALSIALALYSTATVANAGTETITGSFSTTNPLKDSATTDTNTSATSTADLKKGLKAYYRFDNVKASRGYSLEFDGSDDYVAAGSLGSGFSNGFAFSYWVKPVFKGAGNYNYHLSYESGSDSNSVFRIEQDDDANGELDFGIYNSSGGWVEISSTGLQEGEWSHVAGYLDSSGTMELFIDGSSQGTATVTPANDVANSFYIGARHGGQNFFRGEMDQIRIYNQAINSSQIRDIYNQRPVSSEELVTFHDFNEGPTSCDLTAATACLTDDSSNSISATPRNFSDNNIATGSGWIKQTPVNRPSARDRSSGSRLASIYGGYNGQLKNFDFNSSSGWTGGVVGDSALEFSGDGDYVEISDLNYDPENDFSVSYWVQMDNVSKSMSFGDAETNSVFRDWYVGSKLDFYWEDESGSSHHLRADPGFETGKWYHVYFEYDGTNHRVYVDGKELKQLSVGSVDPAPVNTPLSLGISYVEPLNGKLDDVRFYDQELSSKQIKDLSNRKSVSEGLVGRWNFESGDGDTAYDTGMASRGVLRSEAIGDLGEGIFSQGVFNDTFTFSSFVRADKKLFGTGSKGSLTVSTKGRIVNKYTFVENNVSSGHTLPVNSTAGFEVGDEVLIVQMQNVVNGCRAGSYEFRKISQINTGQLVLEKGLENNYCYLDPEVGLPVNKYLPPAGNHTASVAQVVTVPHYTDVTVESGASITAPYWNGTVGGIVAFKASGTLNTIGQIDVKAKGFRGGGAYRLGDDDDGGQGEGLTGWGIQGNGSSCDGRYKNNGIGGGGSLAINNDGGDAAAGGGYGSQGYDMQTGNANCNVPLGGSKAGNPSLSPGLIFGGGGGGGSDSDDGGCSLNPFADDPDGDPNSQPNLCQRGGHGGGIVFVAAREIDNANISANGHTTHPVWDGGPGGGAGGTIWLKSLDIEIEKVTAVGGPKICDHKSGGSDCGGPGGNGRIKISTIEARDQPSKPAAFEDTFQSNLLSKGSAIRIGAAQNVVYGKIQNQTFGISGIDMTEFRNTVLSVNSGSFSLKVSDHSITRQLSGSIADNGELQIAEQLDGSIDEVRIYNRTLSSTELQKLRFQ